MVDTANVTVNRFKGDSDLSRLMSGRLGSAFAALAIGVITGCWIAYVLLYSLSSLPLPRYTLGAVVLLGWYVNHFARSMLDRMAILFGSSLVAYVTAFVAYTLPGILGWVSDPLVQRSLYLRGLRQVFIFTTPAFVLLIVGTFVTYVSSEAYAEITR